METTKTTADAPRRTTSLPAARRRGRIFRHPTIDLAGFRAGGVDYLIGILEDSRADPWKRRLAAREIGFHGTRVAADRIAALAQDTTIVDNGSKIEFDSEKSIEVLGAFVRDAIHQIHEREKR